MASPSLEKDIIHKDSQTASSSEQLSTDAEKDKTTVQEGHNDDIPSIAGVTLENDDGLERPRSVASHQSKSEEAGKSYEANGHTHTKSDLEKGSAETTADGSEDPNIVWWDGPDDPHNPMNYSRFLKLGTIGVVSAICFVTPLASSMFAPGVPQLMLEFESSNAELAGFVVSIYILGFAIGPLLFAPLSEIYGRLPVYHVCNILFIVFTIACARSTNLNMLIGFRLLAGTFGSAPLVNGGGSIADIIVQEKRGGAMALFAMGPIVGPISG
jgi:hypothetical protein